VPEYRAPELWQGQENTEKTDIWALGIILYEMMTLRKPFCAPDIKQLE